MAACEVRVFSSVNCLLNITEVMRKNVAQTLEFNTNGKPSQYWLPACTAYKYTGPNERSGNKLVRL